jgi:hypothetical protein
MTGGHSFGRAASTTTTEMTPKRLLPLGERFAQRVAEQGVFREAFSSM